MAFGPRIVIEAVRDGHQAAKSIDEFLTGGKHLASEYRMSMAAPQQLPTTEWLNVRYRHTSALPIEDRKGFREVEQVYDDATARVQKSRCLRCNIQTVFDSDKCILCGGCVDVCPRGCYRLVRLDRLKGDTTLETAVEARYGAPLSEMKDSESYRDCGTAVIKDEDNCMRCGLCARRCPTGAITMETFEFREKAVRARAGVIR